MSRKTVSKLLDRVDQTIALLEGQDLSADRAPAWTRAVLGMVVGAILVILAFAATDLDSKVMAPLFAMLAATALCVSFIPVNPDRARPPILHYVVLIISGTSSVLAAFHWLYSVGPIDWYIWVLVVVLIVIAIVGIV